MLTPDNYMIFANQADLDAETATDPELQKYFLHMAARWRDLVTYTATTGAFRPGGPRLD